MLERQVASLITDRAQDLDFALTMLGLKSAGTGHVHEWLLEEGFTSTAPSEFARQLLRKIQRRPFARDLEDLIHRSTQDCRLVLARYLFEPAEVVRQALSQVRVTQGVADKVRGRAGNVEMHERRAYEAAILRELTAGAKTYWVSAKTSSRINSLIEFPLGTVVLVIKPPGSDLEIELKRAGQRERPLAALYERNGQAIHYPHRLQGGSLRRMLHWEAAKVSEFQTLYRAVHGVLPSVSATVSVHSLKDLPTAAGDVDLVTYFTDPGAYGEGYPEMRNEMARCVRARLKDGDEFPTGDLALTTAFVRDMKPAQSILTGSSSFRLQTLSDYLSPLGPELYFRDGLRSSFSACEARRFADDLLEEVLGTYVPPEIEYRNHEQYVDAALSVRENRAAADANYQGCLREIGRVWGTLLALGGSTRGESFVARNVGLKSVWDAGAWCVRLVFMDHDGVFFVNLKEPAHNLEAFLRRAAVDMNYLFGSWKDPAPIRGSVQYLQAIYGVNDAMVREGDRQFSAALKAAYRGTLRQMNPEGNLRTLLPEPLIALLLDLHQVVCFSLDGETSRRPGGWVQQARTWLAQRNRPDSLGNELVANVERYQEFFRTFHYLYEEAAP